MEENEESDPRVAEAIREENQGNIWVRLNNIRLRFFDASIRRVLDR